jgi:hypothetical protein
MMISARAFDLIAFRDASFKRTSLSTRAQISATDDF